MTIFKKTFNGFIWTHLELKFLKVLSGAVVHDAVQRLPALFEPGVERDSHAVLVVVEEPSWSHVVAVIVVVDGDDFKDH